MSRFWLVSGSRLAALQAWYHISLPWVLSISLQFSYEWILVIPCFAAESGSARPTVHSSVHTQLAVLAMTECQRVNRGYLLIFEAEHHASMNQCGVFHKPAPHRHSVLPVFRVNAPPSTQWQTWSSQELVCRHMSMCMDACMPARVHDMVSWVHHGSNRKVLKISQKNVRFLPMHAIAQLPRCFGKVYSIMKMETRHGCHNELINTFVFFSSHWVLIAFLLVILLRKSCGNTITVFFSSLKSF